MTPISTIRNLGPAMETAFNKAGIASAEELRALGADKAYARLLASGSRPHFIPYYALHMALQGRPWNDCKGDEKIALRKRFDALIASTAPDPKSKLDPKSELDAFMDQIGLIAVSPDIGPGPDRSKHR